MVSRRLASCALIVTLFATMGAQYRTTNFVVHAQDVQVAKQVGDYAEHYRKEKAVMWLGREMPNWPSPCPLTVNVTMDGPSGATSFTFGQSQVLGQKMEINGPLDRLLASVLPHEVTHTVFAHYFRQPVPRWADEGGSVLSEDEIERERHDRLTRQILNRGQQIPLRRLFSLKEYPREVMCLYAQGFSMSEFLVKRSNHRVFLSFVGHGMQHGWDSAVQSFYGHRNVEDLEEAWLKYLRDGRRSPSQPPPTQVATRENRPSSQPANRPIVRLTLPPVQPLDPSPIVRGVAPTVDQVGQNFGGVPPLVPPSPANPTWVPSPNSFQGVPVYSTPAVPTNMSAPAGSVPVASFQGSPQPYLPVPVTLGPIQPEAIRPAPSFPPTGNPVGFPR